MSTAIKPAPENRANTVKSLLAAHREEFAKVLPKHLTVERLFSVAVSCIARTPTLMQCTTESLLRCIKQAAELGLEPGGPLGHAYLVPFKDVCTLVVGYRGKIQLARNATSGLSQIEAHVVHAKDRFEYVLGMHPKLEHAPSLDASPGAPIAAYCVARLKDGGIHVEVMTWAEIQRVRARSRSGQNGPWVTDEEEMAKKTVVNRASKWLPADETQSREAEIEAESEGWLDRQQAPALPSVNEALEVIEQSATARAKEAVRRKLDVEASAAPAVTAEPGASDAETK